MFILLFLVVLNQSIWTEIERQQLITDLQSTSDSLLVEISELSAVQWQFQETEKRWSIHFIVEHIFLQDQAYYREVKVLSSSPPRLDLELVKANDSIFIKYATDPNVGIADWDVTPIGRFCSLEDAKKAFIQLRYEMIELIQNSTADFRRIYTFRSIPISLIEKNPDFYKPRLRRDLHQLILNEIAHTKRHLRQIRNVKLHKDFPN